jgi:2,4-dienoyl-CoA reductase-like NADH-dependent reductase (Old Yellow Enzyme family)/thioredoxin reductase
MFAKLFESGCIGNLEIANRIVLAPMLTCYTNGPYVSERLIDYLVARAAGGAGLLITEIACVDPLGQLEHNQLAVYDDKFIPGLRKLSEAIHRHGSKIAMQIGHGGRASRSDVIGAQPVSSSAIPQIRRGEIPRELTITEIQDLVNAFVSAAKRAKTAGFDGVEVHCAHNYLLRQFISRYSNTRVDRYGGNIENRTRFASDIVSRIKQELKGYPIWVRINGDDYVPDGGVTLEESKVVAQLLEDAGAEAISVSAGTYDSPQLIWSTQPMFLPPGCIVHLAAGIKSAVKIPVIAAGRINAPSLAEQILHERKADFLAMGRTLLADPEFPNKSAAGRISEIRKCIADNECVHSLITRGLVCTVNAALGREREFADKRVNRPKKIMIVGAGPGGMEAARVTAMRGHQVTVYEKSGDLGGQLNVADKPPFKGDISRMSAFYDDELDRLKVPIILNKEVTPDFVKKQAPDVVILATGASPVVLPIPGASGQNVVMANDVLTGKATTGQKAIVIGGGRVGVEVADYLSTKSVAVTIIEMQRKIGYDLGLSFKDVVMSRLKDGHVNLLTETTAIEIKDNSLVVSRQGTTEVLEADTIVMAVGSRPNKDLENKLPSKIAVYSVGDCVKPRNIIEAVAEGAKVALEI